MVTSGIPASATMSPGPASSMSTRSIPRAVVRLVTLPLSVTVRPGSTEPSAPSGSSRTMVMRWPGFTVPLQTRPTAMRPT